MLLIKHQNNKHEAHAMAFTDVDSAKYKFFPREFRELLRKKFFFARIYFHECNGYIQQFLHGKISPFKVEYTRGRLAIIPFIYSKYKCK